MADLLSQTTLIHYSSPGQDLSKLTLTLRERRGVQFSILLPPPPYGHCLFARKQHPIGISESISPTSPGLVSVSPSYSSSSSSGSSSRSVSVSSTTTTTAAEMSYEPIPVLRSCDTTIPPPAATINPPNCKRRQSLRDRRGVGLYVLTSFAATPAPAPALCDRDAVIPIPSIAKGRLEPTIGNLPRRRKRTTANTGPAV